MNIAASIIEALESLSHNKLRSGLTILGIVIGVGAVIAMVSIGRGAESTITGSIQGIGTNLLFVFRGGAEDVRNPKPLTLEDASAIADPYQAPHVVGVAPVLDDSAKMTYAGESTSTRLTGVTPEYESVRNYKVVEGEFIDEGDMLGEASVVILGPDTADHLFGRREGVTGERDPKTIGFATVRGGDIVGDRFKVRAPPGDENAQTLHL